ncbi:MAG TPA: slipin family protein [Fimbriimonadaceae bacterium]|nr:slipin family protein [Fimbriimonadaceae bacterium]
MLFRQKFVVMEHERALLFHRGRLLRQLEPGLYAFWGTDHHVEKFDLRPSQQIVANQEITCADGGTVRASARANFQIVDIEKAYRGSNLLFSLIYESIHDSLREVLSGLTVEEAIGKRTTLDSKLKESAQEQLSPAGIEVLSCTIRDLGVSGEIKRAYAQQIVAQKEGQAALERARGESAALRSLANAAKAMENNPNLLQLRWIHAMETGKNATVVLSPSGLIPPSITDPEAR